MKLREEEDLHRQDAYRRYKKLKASPMRHSEAIEKMVLEDFNKSELWMVEDEDRQSSLDYYKRIVKAERAKERKEEREIERLRKL